LVILMRVLKREDSYPDLDPYLRGAKVTSSVVDAIRRIRMFLGLLDPDPLVRCTDLDADPPIIKQNSKKNVLLFCDVNLPSKSNWQNNFFLRLEVKDENRGIRGRIRIHWSEVRIRGYESVPKCHGSTTLVTTHK
jgi:hypothetical protein